MNRLLILTCFICSFNAIIAQKNVERVGFRPRIILGKTIQIEDAPYQVSIIKMTDEKRGGHSCGGSIISRNLILTAGHCAKLTAEHYRVRSGSNRWLTGGPLHRVIKIVRHEDYEEDILTRPSHDIAIMKVTPDFKLDGKKERIIELADKDYEVNDGENAFLSGWGHTGKEVIADELKGLTFKTMSSEKCAKIYDEIFDDYYPMTKHNICTNHLSGVKTFCNGDSGSPLVVESKQIGIVSWIPGCALKKYPGVYTDVAKYRDWIDKQLQTL